MISIALMFGGLREWVTAGWRLVPDRKPELDSTDKSNVRGEEWERRRRPVLDALLVMLVTHVAGAALFWMQWKNWISSDMVLVHLA